MDTKDQHIIKKLDHAAALVQTGLYYCQNPYDRERYEQLCAIISSIYGELLCINSSFVRNALLRDFGHATPKLGVEAAIFDGTGQLLLIQRHDDRLWAMPGGWVEVSERLTEALNREVFEETGLNVNVVRPLAISSNLAGEFGRPHSACFITFLCTVIKGSPLKTSEAIEVGFFDPRDETIKWHKDHQNRALLASNRYRYSTDSLPWT